MLLFVHGFQQNREYFIVVVLIITTNLLFVCYSLNSWFSGDIICEISQATASTYSLCSWVSDVLLITYYVGVWEGCHLTLILEFTEQDYLQWSCSFTSAHKSYHSFQSELSSTSGLIVLFFRVLCNGPVREYHGLTMNMLQTDRTFLPQYHASTISTPDLKIIYPDWWFPWQFFLVLVSKFWHIP